MVQRATRHRALVARQRVDDRDEPARAAGHVADPHHRLADDLRAHRRRRARRDAADLALGERVSAITAMQTLAFWQLAGSFFTCGFSMSLLSAHGIPMLTDHGYSPMFASWAFGVLGGSSIGCTVMLGALSDRFGRRPVLAAIYAGRVFIF